MSLPWHIKEGFMEFVKGDQGEHPYAIGLNSNIEEKLSEYCEQRDLCE